MDGLVSRASMIRLSLHPLPASETSAFNKIRAFSTRRAGLFPFRISVSSRSRGEVLNLLGIWRGASFACDSANGLGEPFRSAIREHLKGHTQGLEDLAIEMLARGLSVRDIEDAFKDESGRLLLSKTAVSQLGERLWEDYQAFAKRDLSEYEITYL